MTTAQPTTVASSEKRATARRTFLRSIMMAAWGLYRDGGRTFSEALKGAWRVVRGCQKMRVQRFGRSAVRSSTVERFGASAFVGGRRSAAYLTARVGR